MEFIDSHTHPHFDNYDSDRTEVLKRSKNANVTRLIAVGCSLGDSQKAVDLASQNTGIWATVGSHPHDGSDYIANKNAANKTRELLKSPKVVGIGEIGLDYYHEYSSKEIQAKILREQIEIGLETNLPFVFHVREAFDDFWKIYDSYSTHSKLLKGVIHSFSAAPDVLDEVLARGLYIGLNGITTYTKEDSWRQSAKNAPIDKILLETDAPFLTPVLERGKRCEPKHVAITAAYLADLRQEDIKTLAAATTANTISLFDLSDERLK
jgi:TatD DNase family protein